MRPIMTLSLIALFSVVSTLAARGGTVDRGYTAGRYALQIDQDTRYVRSAEGGTMRADVVLETGGKKHIAGAKADPIRAKINADDFTQFITAALANAGNAQGVNGSIRALNYDYKVQSSREFTNAILTEVAFPTMDAATKDQPALTIVLQPQSVRNGGADGNVLKIAPTSKTKQWLGMFRMSIPGMDTSRVSKIDTFAVTRKVADTPAGEMRGVQIAPSDWQVGNIVCYVAQQHAADFVRWHDDFVVKGNAGDDQEKQMTIEMLDQQGTPVMSVNFTNVGILAVGPEPVEARGSEQVARVRVELYAEKMTLSDKGGGTSPSAAAGAAGEPAPAPAPPPPTAAAPPADGAPPAPAAGAAAPAAPAAPAPPGDKATAGPAPGLAPARAPVAPRRRPAPTVATAPAELKPAPAPVPAPAPARRRTR